MEERYTNYWEDGIYTCRVCHNPLFRSDDKFKSGTPWPSFRAMLPGAVTTKADLSFGMNRTEILCAQCGQHLGHVFDDGKLCGDKHPDAGERYCVLSESLTFNEKDKKQ